VTRPEVGTTPIRVLVVDDEVDFATALAARLQHRGFSVQAAFSGAAAVRHVSNEQVDVVLLDLKMPEMDGLATLREMRRVAPGVRVIVLTGHGTVERGIEGMQFGAEDFLQKPADIDALCTAIIATAERSRDEGVSEEGGGGRG
jgi:DNA-binding response OmpR family regulator